MCELLDEQAELLDSCIITIYENLENASATDIDESNEVYFDKTPDTTTIDDPMFEDLSLSDIPVIPVR